MEPSNNQRKLIENLDQLDNDQLLNALSFSFADYTPEAAAILGDLARNRGISAEDITSYRRNHLPTEKAQTTCANCEEELDLDSGDLICGSFSCPECSHEQLIVYRQIRFHKEPNFAPRELANQADNIQLASNQERKSRKELRGISGWIVVLGVIVVWGLFLSLLNLGQAISTKSPILIGVGIVDISFMCIVTYLYFSKKRLFRAFFLVGVAASVFVAFATVIDLNPPPNALKELLGRAFFAAIWSTYLLRSRRVQATFVYPLILRRNQPSSGAPKLEDDQTQL